MRKRGTISKILKLKDNKKKELELEVKKASDKADEEKHRLQSLEKDCADTMNYFYENHSEGSLDINNINSYYDFFSRINGRIGEQKKIHNKRQSELKLLKNHLVEAHQDKRAFEILNERAIKEDLREKASSEQKDSDFLAISRRAK